MAVVLPVGVWLIWSEALICGRDENVALAGDHERRQPAQLDAGGFDSSRVCIGLWDPCRSTGPKVNYQNS